MTIEISKDYYIIFSVEKLEVSLPFSLMLSVIYIFAFSELNTGAC